MKDLFVGVAFCACLTVLLLVGYTQGYSGCVASANETFTNSVLRGQ